MSRSAEKNKNRAKKAKGRIVVFSIALLLLLLGIGLWICLLLPPADAPVSPEPAPSSLPGSVSSEPEPTPAPTPTKAPSEPFAVDFSSLRAHNPDVIGYIRIPNTNISYPILFREGDNEYYLSHNIDGKKSSKGAIFIEDYNAPDFSDPVTVLYGHRHRSKEMFSMLEILYSDPAFFAKNRTVSIYLPDRTYTYEIFSAAPHTREHLLYTYDFTNPNQFDLFFAGVRGRDSGGLNAVNDPDVIPDSENDHVLILSTCLWGDNQVRYLVMARRVD